MASTAVAKPDQTQVSQVALIQTVPAVQLYRAQRQVAQYLEIAYLNLTDHPDVAKEVRMTAQDSRERHLLTTELMKKFQATGHHILNNLIPNIYLGIGDLQSKSLVQDTFTQIIQSAEIMQQEAEKTRQSYLELQRKVQLNKESVNTRNVNVKKEKKMLDKEMTYQKKLVGESKQAQANLDKQKQAMEEDLRKMKLARDASIKAEADFDNEEKQGLNAMDKALIPTAILGPVTGGLGFVAAAIMGGISIFGHVKEKEIREAKAKRLTEKRQKDEEAYHERMDEQTDLIEKLNEERRNELDKLNAFKTLCLEKTALGDVHSLEEAALYLGLVDKQFTKLAMFWSNMAAVLTYLKDDTDTGSLYLKRIADKRFADLFKKSIQRAEMDWAVFNAICKSYVIETDKAIFVLYEWLSAPVETMSKENRTVRIQARLKQIKDEIEDAYPVSTESVESADTPKQLVPKSKDR